jgi:hypothetical protein
MPVLVPSSPIVSSRNVTVDPAYGTKFSVNAIAPHSSGFGMPSAYIAAAVPMPSTELLTVTAPK